MKIMLIMPFNSDLLHAVSLPLGIISIGSYLQANGHTVKICDLSASHLDISKEIELFSPDIAGVSCSSVKSIEGMISVSKKLRKRNIPIVWGGPFCDVAIAEDLFNTGCVDIVSFSEGEETWLQLVRALENGEDIHKTTGIAYMENGRVVYTPQRPFLDLSVLPKLDFSLVDVPSYFQYLYGCKKLVYVYLSKGCPAQCTFCTNQLSHRRTYRRRPLGQFMEEVHELISSFGVDGLYFCDELCFTCPNQLNEVCDAFDNSGLNFHWGFQTRIGILGEEDFSRAYKSGCRWVDFGVESGNKEMLQKIRKGIPYDKIEPTFEWCDKAGIISLANFIIGLPGETVQQITDTVALAMRIKATQCTFMQFCRTPHTDIEREIEESGLPFAEFKNLRQYRKADFFLSRTKNLSQVPRKEIEVVQSHFLWQAIFRKDYGSDAHSYDLFIKHIKTLLTRISYLDFSARVKCFTELCLLFLRFFNDTHFHPVIYKKYGLKK